MKKNTYGIFICKICHRFSGLDRVDENFGIEKSIIESDLVCYDQDRHNGFKGYHKKFFKYMRGKLIVFKDEINE